MDLTHASVVSIRNAVLGKKISSEEVVRHFLGRIEKLDKKLNSFIAVNANAVQEAGALDKLIAEGNFVGPLAGVPIAIKDLLCTEGLKTTAGSKILGNFIPPYSATVVQRLKAAGAIIIGKTNLDEFAMGSSTETSAFGATKNPWNTDYVPGGSSGGSAAALAARLVPGAIGTDTGGSIRQPASFCGVYGLKPTYGRVSRYGIIAYASSLDQAGPMARSTKDCAVIFETIAGKCVYDSTSSGHEVRAWERNATGRLDGIRIGLPKEYFEQAIDAEVTKRTQEAVSCLRSKGAEIVEVSIPLVKYAVPIYYLIATSEASSNLARYDGVRYGHRSTEKSGSLDEFYSLNRGEGFGTEVKRRIMLGTYALSSGYYQAYYQKACQVRRLLQEEFMRSFEHCDILLSPVATSPAFKIGEKISDPLEMYLNDIFTTSTNLVGLPGMSVPAGFSTQGLPIGVQLTGKKFDEKQIFDVASVLEENLLKEERIPHVI